MRHLCTKLKGLFVKRSINIARRMDSTITNKIAVCQMTANGNKEDNLKVITELISKASKENVKMIFFPEACDYISDNKQTTIDMCESVVGGTLVNKYKELALKYNVWLSMGGIHEKDDLDPTKMYNTHLIISSKGKIVQSYRKLHLFDVDIPEKKVRLMESDFSKCGSHIVTPVDSPVGKIGMSICYDLRFPELSTQLAMMGADILTYPSAFTYSTGEAHWEVLLRSRAIENQCFVIAAAQVGDHNAKRKSYGRAMCVDPWGTVLANCGEESPSYKVAEIDIEKMNSTRTNMPVFKHRRKSIYSLYALSLRNSLLDEHKETQLLSSSVDSVASYDGRFYVFGHVKVPESCVFYTSQYSYAFVNLRCVIPGHVLIAPIRLAERNNDMTPDEARDFFDTIRLVQRLMERVQHTNSCTVTIQDGPDAGQTVKHVHCHVMPRKKGDFIQSDLIYLELAKHDQLCTGHPSKPARTLQEMENEAKILKSQMEKMLSEQFL